MCRFPIILLALAVALANTVCACASAGRANTYDRCAASHPPAHACHQSEASATPAANATNTDQGKQAPGDVQSCAHCNGMFVADASPPKVSAPPLAIVPAFSVHAHSAATVDERDVEHLRLTCTGLAPPLDATTLINLFCSLNS